MRELYQCTSCGWLTTIYRLLTWTGKDLICSQCMARRAARAAKEGATNAPR